MDLFDEEFIDGEIFLFSRYGTNNLEEYLDKWKLDFNHTETPGSITIGDEFGIVDIAKKKVYSDNYVAALPEPYEGGNDIKDELGIKHLYRTNSKVGSYKITDYGKTLYIWMGKTDFYDDAALIDFCLKWGIPCGYNFEDRLHTKDRSLAFITSDIDLELIPLVNSFKSVFDAYTKVIIEEDLDWCIEHRPHKMLRLTEFTEEDVSELIELIHGNPEEYERALRMAKWDVADDLEANLSFEVQLRMNGSSSKSQIYVNFKNLVEICFYYLGKAFFEKAELRKCEYCNHYFEVTDNRQRFCPPPPTHKRSICETAYNNRRKRELKKSNTK